MWQSVECAGLPESSRLWLSPLSTLHPHVDEGGALDGMVCWVAGPGGWVLVSVTYTLMSMRLECRMGCSVVLSFHGGWVLSCHILHSHVDESGVSDGMVCRVGGLVGCVPESSIYTLMLMRVECCMGWCAGLPVLVVGFWSLVYTPSC